MRLGHVIKRLMHDFECIRARATTQMVLNMLPNAQSVLSALGNM